jgi:hypothetical protein
MKVRGDLTTTTPETITNKVLPDKESIKNVILGENGRRDEDQR